MEIHYAVLILAIYVPTIVHLQLEPRRRPARVVPPDLRFRRPASRDAFPFDSGPRSTSRSREPYLPDSPVSDLPRPTLPPDLGERRRSDRRFRPPIRRRRPYPRRFTRPPPLDPYTRPPPLYPRPVRPGRDRTPLPRGDPYVRRPPDPTLYGREGLRSPSRYRSRGPRFGPKRDYYPPTGAPDRRSSTYGDLPYTRPSSDRRAPPDYLDYPDRGIDFRRTFPRPDPLYPRRERYPDPRRRKISRPDRRGDPRARDIYSQDADYIYEYVDPSRDPYVDTGPLPESGFPLDLATPRDELRSRPSSSERRLDPISRRNGDIPPNFPRRGPPFEGFRSQRPFPEVDPIDERNALTRSHSNLPRTTEFIDRSRHVRSSSPPSAPDPNQSGNDTNSTNADINSVQDGFLSEIVAETMDAEPSRTGVNNSSSEGILISNDSVSSGNVSIEGSFSDNNTNMGENSASAKDNMNDTLKLKENLTAIEKSVNSSSETKMLQSVNSSTPSLSTQIKEQSLTAQEQNFDIHNVLNSPPVSNTNVPTQDINLSSNKKRRIGSANTFMKKHSMDIPIPLGLDLSTSSEMVVDLTRKHSMPGNNIQPRDSEGNSRQTETLDRMNSYQETIASKPEYDVFDFNVANTEGASYQPDHTANVDQQPTSNSHSVPTYQDEVQPVGGQPAPPESPRPGRTRETVSSSHTETNTASRMDPSFERDMLSRLPPIESQDRLRNENNRAESSLTGRQTRRKILSRKVMPRRRRLRPAGSNREETTLPRTSYRRDLMQPENYTRDAPSQRRRVRLTPSERYRDEPLASERHDPIPERPFERDLPTFQRRLKTKRRRRPYREDPLATEISQREPIQQTSKRRPEARINADLPRSMSSERSPSGESLFPRRRRPKSRTLHEEEPTTISSPERRHRGELPGIPRRLRPYKEPSLTKTPERFSRRDSNSRSPLPRRSAVGDPSIVSQPQNNSIGDRLASTDPSPPRRSYSNEISDSERDAPLRGKISPVQRDEPSVHLFSESPHSRDIPLERISPPRRAYPDDSAIASPSERGPMEERPLGQVLKSRRRYTDGTAFDMPPVRSSRRVDPHRRPYALKSSTSSLPSGYEHLQRRPTKQPRPYTGQFPIDLPPERRPEESVVRESLSAQRRTYIDEPSIYPLNEGPSEGEILRDRPSPSRQLYTDEGAITTPSERYSGGFPPETHLSPTETRYLDENTAAQPPDIQSLPILGRSYRNETRMTPASPSEVLPLGTIPREGVLQSRRLYTDLSVAPSTEITQTGEIYKHRHTTPDITTVPPRYDTPSGQDMPRQRPIPSRRRYRDDHPVAPPSESHIAGEHLPRRTSASQRPYRDRRLDASSPHEDHPAAEDSRALPLRRPYTHDAPRSPAVSLPGVARSVASLPSPRSSYKGENIDLPLAERHVTSEHEQGRSYSPRLPNADDPSVTPERYLEAALPRARHPPPRKPYTNNISVDPSAERGPESEIRHGHSISTETTYTNKTYHAPLPERRPGSEPARHRRLQPPLRPYSAETAGTELSSVSSGEVSRPGEPSERHFPLPRRVSTHGEPVTDPHETIGELPRHRRPSRRRPHTDESFSARPVDRPYPERPPRRRLAPTRLSFTNESAYDVSQERSLGSDGHLQLPRRSYTNESHYVPPPEGSQVNEHPPQSHLPSRRTYIESADSLLPETTHRSETPRRRLSPSRRPYRPGTSHDPPPERSPRVERPRHRRLPSRRAVEPSHILRPARPPGRETPRHRLPTPQRPRTTETSLPTSERSPRREPRRRRLLPSRRRYTTESTYLPPEGPVIEPTRRHPPRGSYANESSLPSHSAEARPRRPYRPSAASISERSARRRRPPPIRSFTAGTDTAGSPPSSSRSEPVPSRRRRPTRYRASRREVSSPPTRRRRVPPRIVYIDEPSSTGSRSHTPSIPGTTDRGTRPLRQSPSFRRRSHRTDHTDTTLIGRIRPSTRIHTDGSQLPLNIAPSYLHESPPLPPSPPSPPSPSPPPPHVRRRPVPRRRTSIEALGRSFISESEAPPIRYKPSPSVAISGTPPHVPSPLPQPPSPPVRRHLPVPRRRTLESEPSGRRLISRGEAPPVPIPEAPSNIPRPVIELAPGTNAVAGVRLGVVRARGGENGFPVHGGYCPGERCADGGLAAGLANGTGTGTLEAFLERRRTGANEDIGAYKRELGSLTIT